MKRVFNLRMIVAVAGLFVAVGLFAQGTAIPGWDNGAGGDNYETTGATYVIEGGTIPVYAQPDPYYHPSYDEAAGTGITAAFTWTWTEATLTFSQNNANDNYVEITAPAGSAAGSPYTVNVTENSSFGGCNDGGTNITINVVAAPAITWEASLASPYEDCEGGASLPAVADILATVSGGYQAYRTAWTLEIKTLTDLGVDEFWYDDELGTTQFGVQTYAVNNTQVAPDATLVSGDNDVSTVTDFLVVNNGTVDATTVYTYSLNGINDQASRWSDFLTLAAGVCVKGNTPDDFTYLDLVAETLVVTVHPTPTTGDIYHIDSGWAN